ncbi:MAG: hypothetical protein COV74_03890 [Candidatus Omnitrophica bacterium CG11_big_fil_rev_8_21_14_0_20_45_26]|uniref:PilZ domain-containing protein n=1 Tax=Candidatus Abzuiibacterium crystallinum TaxID=1974748 RepID=A0A2H0LQL7_9BACT|nr:MAG: hypothetical protein COV74_03890 [Candidatus Omnitrophica bacterium CG11_big_fil_rev_8_21_14_0_20_45_26]PIW65442.1 MAG: hypothetical protein COW12_01920 [Candidatus Omnitrophica bacterium CG12_big_fil_rev_8_21_14_0_65_45_16]
MPLSKLARRKRIKTSYQGFERRNYVRLTLDQPLRFRTINPLFIKEFQVGRAKNISQDGALFKTVTPPPRKSYILLDIDLSQLNEQIRLDKHLVVMNHKIVGKVMRIHLNLETGLFDVGVRFVRPIERESQAIEALLEEHS